MAGLLEAGYRNLDQEVEKVDRLHDLKKQREGPGAKADGAREPVHSTRSQTRAKR